MGNPIRGAVTFEAADRTWTMVYSVNALIELEDTLGISATEIASQLGDPSKMTFKLARTMFWAGLRDHHADVDHRQAGELMTAIEPARAFELIAKAFVGAFPAKDSGPRKPPATAGGKTQPGTGKSS